MEEKQNAVLGTAPLGRLMMKFALPCTVSLLVGALYNIVDQIFIGWGVGYLGNGATNVVFPLTVLALGLAVMIGDGACSYVSICFGKNQPENANRAVGSAVALSVLVGIAVAVLYAVFQMPLLTLFGATEANLSYAKEYFTYITIGVPIYVFGQAINPIIRSDGSPQFAMLSMLAGAIANCILDPIAIFVLHWGVMGAAAATVAGQVITAAMGVWYLFHTKALRLKADDFKLRGRILGAYLPLGLCSFLAQISLVIAMAATNNMLVQYGASSKYGADIPLTVLGIVMKVFQIIISITIGMAAGCIPIVGYNYGAQLLRRCRGVVWLGIGVVQRVCRHDLPRISLHAAACDGQQGRVHLHAGHGQAGRIGRAVIFPRGSAGCAARDAAAEGVRADGRSVFHARGRYPYIFRFLLRPPAHRPAAAKITLAFSDTRVILGMKFHTEYNFL